MSKHEENWVRWGVWITHFLLILSVAFIGIFLGWGFSDARELGLLGALVLGIPLSWIVGPILGKVFALFWASLAVAIELSIRFPLRFIVLVLLSAIVAVMVVWMSSVPSSTFRAIFLLICVVAFWYWGFREGGTEFKEFGGREGIVSFWAGYLPAAFLHASPLPEGVSVLGLLVAVILFALFRVPQVYYRIHR